jgi:glycosyltransferase involved in cell wall biosynthesis
MILLISGVFPPEPVVSASISFDLALYLSKYKVVKVISPKPSRPYGFSYKNILKQNFGFEHIIVNSFTYPKSNIFGRILESFSFGTEAANFIKNQKEKIDCIYINAWPLLAQYLIVRAAKKYSIPTVLHVQDIYPESLLDKLPFLKNFFIKILLPLDKYILRNSTEIIAISSKMRSYLIESRKIDENRIKVFYNWQDEKRFLDFVTYKEKRSDNFKRTFMFLGSLNRTAAIDNIINAFHKSNLSNCRLVIAGSGSEKEKLISLVNRLSNPGIEFWDAPFDKVPEIQDKADVMILSLRKGSSLYSLPSKFPAYLYSSKPVIACVDEESDVSETIKKAECGWVVEPDNINELSDQFLNIAEIPRSVLTQMGLKGKEYALKDYSKETNLKRLVDVILKYNNLNN